ncbi:MAG: serine protease [Pseudomonadota bacterium]|nr:serine protease [Pseudomonadota bacterium]
MTKIGGHLCALIASISTYAQGHNWVLVDRSKENVSFYLDDGSALRDGTTTAFWMKVLWPINQTDPQQSVEYRYIVVRVLNDCEDRRYLFEESYNYNNSDVLVKQEITPTDQWHYSQIAAGSIFDEFRERVCAASVPSAAPAPLYIAPVEKTRPVVALTPNVDLKSIANADWRLVGDGSEDKMEYSIDANSVTDDKDGVVVVLRRSYSDSSLTSGHAVDYTTVYGIDAFNCDKSLIAVIAEDYYNSAGKIVWTEKIEPKDLKPSTVVPQSIGEVEQSAACKLGRDKSKSASVISRTVYSSGTAWLTNKGYLITADHVVRGSKSLSLAQDGRSVGTAIIIEEDPANDVAILKPTLTDGLHPAIPLSENPTNLGE